MKQWLIGALVAVVAATSVPTDAEARRFGGGSSSGMQRNMPARTAPDAPPPKPATPPQSQQAAPANAAAGTAPAAAAAKRSWMGPIAGLAAGLGIAALMSHLGLGEAFGNFLMIALLAVAAIFLVRFVMRRMSGGASTRGPALASAAGPAVPSWQAPAVSERRSLDSASTSAAAAQADVPADPAASATEPTPAVPKAFVPAAFDSEGFSRIAKMIFIRMQTANDGADLDDLRRFTTPEMFAAARLEIQERGAAAQHTDVVRVDAEVLDVANEADRQVVSVRFHGKIVEAAGTEPVDFNEIWHLVKPHDDSRSWAIAGIEQSH